MFHRIQRAVYALLPGLLLALLMLFPTASIAGVTRGLALWANAVLPALLPFFVVTTLLQRCGALYAISPLLRPLCRLFRIPDFCGGLLIAAWLSGAPNGARLLQEPIANGTLTQDQAARFVSAATVTSPLFLIGISASYLGSPMPGLLIYGIHFLCALCNGLLWRRFGRDELHLSAPQKPPTALSPLSALPDALRAGCRSALLVGAAIAFFSSVTAVIQASGFQSALTRVLLFALPADAVAPLLSGFFEISQGAADVCQSALPLPLRASMLCALCAFGGLSVLCQAQAFLSGKVRFSLYFCQRITHAALSFAVCRGIFLLFGSAIPVFSVSSAATQMTPSHIHSIPVLLLCCAYSLLFPHKTAATTQGR